MRLAYVLFAATIVAGCGDGQGPLAQNQDPFAQNNDPCSVNIQLQAVHAIMEEWYFFNDEPAQQQKYANLNINDYTSAEALLNFLRFDPGRFDRGFSFITTAAGDEQFFGEGEFVGFGFGSKFVDPPFNTDLRLTQIFAGSPAAVAPFKGGSEFSKSTVVR